jgi:putative membrane protein
VIVAPRWGLLNALRYVGRRLAGLFAWDVVVAVLYVQFDQKWLALDNLPMPLIGTALALLVAVRNNNAYARWWEARQLWGGVVNYSRTLARQVRLYLPDEPVAPILVGLQVAYAHALRCHLRRQEPWDQIENFVTPDMLAQLHGSSNVPDALLKAIADRLAALRRAGSLDTVGAAAFDSTLTALANMQGGAERLKNTPLSLQYTVFPTIFVQIFSLLLPLAMVPELGLATPFGSAVVGCIFLILDRIGADLENPFENSIHDVPMTAITRTIEINLREGLGQTDLPGPLRPEKGILC